MSKYILAGGSDMLYEDYGKSLAAFVESKVESPTILSCLFSHDADERESKSRDWNVWFGKYFSRTTRVVNADEEDFYDQVLESDVIYLHGGTTQKLLDNLPDFERVKKVFEGKIVIGSSAGANYLSQICYSPTAGKVLRGSGILPFGVMVHYGISGFNDLEFTPESWIASETNLRESSMNTPILQIPEGTFVIVDQ